MAKLTCGSKLQYKWHMSYTLLGEYIGFRVIIEPKGNLPKFENLEVFLLLCSNLVSCNLLSLYDS
jgi:hypothetical protein